MAKPALGYALVAIAASSWGTWPLILRHAEAIGPVPPALESVLVMGILTVVTAPLVLFDRVRVRATRAQWAAMGWLGVADALNFILFFAAYQATSVAVAVLNHYLAPIFVALAAPLVLRERARSRTFIAVALSFVGLVLLLSPWNAERHAGDWLGAAFGAGSAVFYASNVLVNKRLTGVFSGSELMFFHGVIATPLLVALVPRAAWAEANVHAMGIVALGALGPGALAGLLFVWGLRRIEASHASTLTLLEPLVAVLSAAVVFHEKLGWGAGVGAVLILGGAAIVVSKPIAAREAADPTL